MISNGVFLINFLYFFKTDFKEYSSWTAGKKKEERKGNKWSDSVRSKKNDVLLKWKLFGRQSLLFLFYASCIRINTDRYDFFGYKTLSFFPYNPLSSKLPWLKPECLPWSREILLPCQYISASTTSSRKVSQTRGNYGDEWIQSKTPCLLVLTSFWQNKATKL